MTCQTWPRPGLTLATAMYVAGGIVSVDNAVAQVALPAEQTLDPDSPLDALPDLGVDWPDIAAQPSAPGQGLDQLAVDTAAPETTEGSVRYDLSFEGLQGDQLALVQTQFDAMSALKAGARQPANIAQIDRRAREDAGVLTDLLRARGFYDAEVTQRIVPQPGRALVTLVAQPGVRYRFTAVEVRGLDGAPDEAEALREAFGIKVDDPVDAAAVTAGVAAMATQLQAEGYPFQNVPDPDIVVDHETRTATLVLSVAPRGRKRYGQIVVPPGSIFSARHLAGMVRFKRGQPFEARDMEDLRRALVATGLVSSVRIEPQPGAAPDEVDIAVAIERAPPRTLAAELGYGTGEGARAAVSWQHRNLLPPEGGVTFRGVLGTREQTVGASLRRNNFFRRDRVLTADLAFSNLSPPGYRARTVSVSAGLERQTNIIYQKRWAWSAALNILATDETGAIGNRTQTARRTFLIAAVPLVASYDRSNNLLDPTNGFRLSARLSPELSLQDGAFGYARLQLDGSTYRPISQRVVLAGRLRIGSIAGAAASRIAPSRRFFAGGGGSIRGYGFQAIGPRDVDNDPTGGRSLAEFAAEARIRFSPKSRFRDFSVVPFLDGGNIYATGLPDFTGLRYGAGIGVRYHSNFGPIRVDLGTPINRQKSDSRLTLFVSLGQAF